MSSVNRLVSVKNANLNALQDMGIDIAADIPVFTRWAIEAEKNKIGSYYSYCRKIAVLDITGCAVHLPCDAAFVQAAILGDHGCDCSDLFDRFYSSIPTMSAFSPDNAFTIIDNAGLYSCISTKIKWYVQGGKLMFKQNYDGQKVTIQYLGFETDAQGFPMVLESHLEAIVEYIMYKYCVRSKFSALKMTDSDRKHHQMEYIRLACEARATDAEISDGERQEIIAMIHDPFIGYGLNVSLMG